jgi:hypothetical protein
MVSPTQYPSRPSHLGLLKHISRNSVLSHTSGSSLSTPPRNNACSHDVGAVRTVHGTPRYRAPELCGSFFTRYSPAVDVWGLGCILAEVMMQKPLFPGRNVVHQLELITDLLGTPSPESMAKVENEKARRFLLNMPHKPPVPLEKHFVGVHPTLVQLLGKMITFDPSERWSAAECLASPIFNRLRSRAHESMVRGWRAHICNLITLVPAYTHCGALQDAHHTHHNTSLQNTLCTHHRRVASVPSLRDALRIARLTVDGGGRRGAPQATPINRMMFSFEKSKPSTESVRALIYEEVLNYHPAIKAEHEKGSAGVHPSFKYPRCAVWCLHLVGTPPSPAPTARPPHTR